MDLHSFGDYCRGDEPRACNETRIYFKNSRARIAPQTGTRLAGSLDPAGPATQPWVSSRPIQAIRWDETSITDDQDYSAPAHARG